MTTQHSTDVVIIGAGISGVGVAARLRMDHPDLDLVVFERREAMGGTWDLFKYPGIRSDSDMLTFGFGFRPWHGTKVLSDGPSIKAYVEQTAAEFGITERTKFGTTVEAANWDSATQTWTTTVVNAEGETEIWTSRFAVLATGYYDYDNAHRPTWTGEKSFKGEFVHPQFWPEDLDVTGKKVVVIGSGATAITLIPNLAAAGADVTMLQRSPSYIGTVPETDPVSVVLEKARVPKMVSYHIGRVRNIALQQGIYRACKAAPGPMRALLLAQLKAQIGDVDMEHFMPSYKPWDERLCVVPNGDLFRTLRRGEARIVTDHIKKFDKTGILLEGGEHLDADIVVTATGLTIKVGGGIDITVDGEPVPVRDRMLYKGVMLEGVPNAILVLGYTNASWTLKVDLAATYFSRLLSHLTKRGFTSVVPTADPDERRDVSVMGDSMRSGYIARGDAAMPRQGKSGPWRIKNDYLRDWPMLKRSKIDDGALTFTRHAANAVDKAGDAVSV